MEVMTDLYGILGLTPRATANEIKSAYRRLARKYHPDVSASRSHAVLIVVPLFLSAFYVMVSKPTMIEESRLIGRVVILALALYGLVYLVRNLAMVLSRYTYHIPDHLTSVFREQEVPNDKSISRRAG